MTVRDCYGAINILTFDPSSQKAAVISYHQRAFFEDEKAVP